MKRIGIFLLKKLSITRRLWQGFLGLIVFGIAAYIVAAVWTYPAKLAEVVTTIWWQKIFLVVSIIGGACSLAGLGIDGLRRTRWGHALDHLPTAILEKPEVLVRLSSDVYARGVLLGIKKENLCMLDRESVSDIFLAEVFLPTGGPLNPGATAGIILVPHYAVFKTGKKGRDLFQRVITLGGGTNGEVRKEGAHSR